MSLAGLAAGQSQSKSDCCVARCVRANPQKKKKPPNFFLVFSRLGLPSTVHRPPPPPPTSLFLHHHHPKHFNHRLHLLLPSLTTNPSTFIQTLQIIAAMDPFGASGYGSGGAGRACYNCKLTLNSIPLSTARHNFFPTVWLLQPSVRA
jgi:hypothetical protein